MTAQERTPQTNANAGTDQEAALATTKRTDRRSLLRSALGAAAATAGVGVLMDTQSGRALADAPTGSAANTPMGNFGQSSFKSTTSTPTVTVKNSGSGGGIVSTGFTGVQGISTNNTSGAGVVANGGYYGVSSVGTVIGTYSQGSSIGVSALGTNGTGTGVYGAGGNSSGGVGVSGSGFTGVTGAGDNTSGTGVSGSGFTGVSGDSPTIAGIGVQGTANGGGDAFGVYGNGYVGVGGLGSFGVYGVSANSGGYGMWGYTQYDNGAGVYGLSQSSSSYGVYGQGGNGYGVYGQSGNSAGVYGSGVSGVVGDSTSTGGVGTGGTASGEWGTGVYGYSSATAGYGVYGESSYWAGYFSGSVDVVGTLAKSGGTFKIDHPLAPASKYLYHSFVESPDMMNIYSGRAVLDGSGRATVTLPDWFDALNAQVLYQLTAVGGPGAGLYIAEEVSNNRFAIAGGTPGLEVCWQVTGVRQDAWANAHRVQVEVDKPAEEQGYYLHPELFGAPADRSIAALRRPSVPQAPATPTAPQRPTVPAPAR